MALDYEQRRAELFQAPHERFVAERKRISSELKASGDKAGAARLAKLNRPPVSAWAVNQLWWQARSEVEQLFATAARQREGDRTAAGAHRQQLAALRARAGEILQAAGHGSNETTLRRVTMTLAALAAAGSFEPDSPGALSGDRDPPGFEAAFGEGFAASAGDEEPSLPKAPPREPTREGKRDQGKDEHATREQAKREAAAREEARRRFEAEERERRRIEAERRAERARLQAALNTAEKEVEARERAVAERREALSAAEQALARARSAAEEAEARLNALNAEE
jgi:hypothetical protein